MRSTFRPRDMRAIPQSSRSVTKSRALKRPGAEVIVARGVRVLLHARHGDVEAEEEPVESQHLGR